MTDPPIESPGSDEYAPFFEGYVSLARGRDPISLLHRQSAILNAGCRGMTDAEALHRYAPGKWSIKQVLGHMADTERVFSYRLLRIGRGDATPLNGFDGNAYVTEGDFDRRPLPALLDDFAAVRASTIRLVDGIAPPGWTRRGVASDWPVSARALLFIMVGHVEHHTRILRERYEVAVPEAGTSDGV